MPPARSIRSTCSDDIPLAACLLPSPACGRGAGGEGRHWHTDTRHFVETPALSRTLSRKREREHPQNHPADPAGDVLHQETTP
ncbi:hypothetical protein CBM2592_B20056 [Cupriavidus taiwanensis]|nr:hypothetical protein CBM2588_B20056 [Cupriavidus taiwanensis]SOY69868.1 hypothetical protein CBM2592_B20056 [Cupriavidus taiwanensis]SOY92275.1 hypothetical protein CBM2591_B10348 [Cupriavidus taiwanensis]SOZ29430.1 hypothetical protein CBM2608_B20057 [Cupriavidus taiwanensis]SOZ74040.1 hypothetical protein CBM2617_B30029 [Cupriavidus taiwanensis]